VTELSNDKVELRLERRFTGWNNSILLWVAVLIIGQLLVLGAGFWLIVVPIRANQDKSSCRSEIYGKVFHAQAQVLSFVPGDPKREPYLRDMKRFAEQLINNDDIC